jgi:dephospho-CoA kinase
MIKLGLTGSIGMGKSTTAQMFAEEGCDLWDADAAVHRLYGPGGAAVGPIGAEFPGAVFENAISRAALRDIISDDPTALKRIEAIVHPLVAQDRAEFLAASSSQIVVLDIPLLYETGGDAFVDAVVVVSTSPEEQKRRVLDRGTMTLDTFNTILAKQTPDAEKRKRADFVIRTDTLEDTRQQVKAVIKTLKEGQDRA